MTNEFDIWIESTVLTMNRLQLKDFLHENQYRLITANKPNIGDWYIQNKNNQHVGLLVVWK